jgi:hypothetical protein
MAALLLTLLLAAQPAPEKFPVEDHCWLRFKPETWVTNKIVVEVNGKVVETVQKQRLKERSDEDYVIEVTESLNGRLLATHMNWSSNGVITGKETLTVDGKEYPCQVSIAKGRREEGETESRYWMPKGNKYPLKVEFKQPNFEGVLKAVAVDEKVKIGEREYLCSKMEGKVKQGPSEGTMTVWVNQEIPGAQARLELVLQTPSGELKLRATPQELHEEK